ncbi:hypothetical protein NC652_038813 [Populus alba x Populus x berolinensis]|nr:hypothetical protein NC652_038813 [Populus alba x Populus x berolinensis]
MISPFFKVKRTAKGKELLKATNEVGKQQQQHEATCLVEQRDDTGPADKWCQLPFHQGGIGYYLNNTYARIG